ncbi:hypothetical protein [Streptomyces sp. NPDC004538]|uniref:hypothetical protein n=1 Tax=Streptomyces sp. NPDC004538 TaxID=3154279 RepID=UPI0033B3F4E3
MAEHGNVYVDMVGDLFHPGHVALLRAARDFGERLTVGVLPDAPYRVTTEFLDRHGIDVVVHGDDLTPDAVEEVFGPVAAAGRLRLVRYTAGVSTTDLIHRCRAAAAP